MSALKKQKVFSDGDWVRILSFDFRLANGTTTELALNIQKIKEVVDLSDYVVHPLTASYYPLTGLLGLRGASVPVLDLNYFLSNTKSYEESINDNQRIVICEFQKLLLGILVAKTHKIRQFDNAEVKKIPEAMGGLSNNVFNGILEVEGKCIKLLDIEFILTRLNVDVAPAPATHGAKDINLRGKHILVVEDSRLFQKKLVAYFQDKHATVTVAEDGIDGLKKLKEGPRPDLIFTDIEMPGLNGIGMVRAIKKEPEYAHIPIIFNTSISNQGLIDDIRSEALGAYIVKFDEEEIKQSLLNIFPG